MYAVPLEPPFHLFPKQQPDVVIESLPDTSFRVDCREMQWWYGIPCPGEETFAAAYDAVTGKLDILCHTIALSPARIHGAACTKVAVTEWRSDRNWEAGTQHHYCTLNETEVDWVAFSSVRDGIEHIQTFRDPGFADSWGKSWAHDGCRSKACTGRFRKVADETYETTDSLNSGEGFYLVRIGSHVHECIRLLDFGEHASESEELNEVYVNRDGRTVYRRQYRGRKMGFGGKPADEYFPNAHRITIDGCVYVHCDCSAKSHVDITLSSVTPDTQQVDPADAAARPH